MAKIIAVYGNGGSYKTTTSLMMANQILKIDGKASVIIVGIDGTKPLLPLAAPEEKKFKGSIGNCLSAVSFEQDTLYKNIYMADDRIGILSFNIRENYNTYAVVSDDRIDDMYTILRHSADYVIVDCTSDIVGNKLCNKAIINADRVVELLTCDINGLVFDGSQESILQSEQYRYRDFIRLVSLDNRFKQDESAMAAALGGITGKIPYSTKAAEYFNQAALLRSGADDKVYTAAIRTLTKLVIEED